MLIRVWYVLYTLPQRELEKVRLVKLGHPGHLGPNGQLKIRYNKHRCQIEREFPSTKAAIEWAESQRTPNKDYPEIMDEYVVVFAACEAKYGEQCERMDGAWESMEQDLFSSEELEACCK